MGTLVLDIETASPFEELAEDSNETQYYEWVAVGLAYVDDLGEVPETDVRTGINQAHGHLSEVNIGYVAAPMQSITD